MKHHYKALQIFIALFALLSLNAGAQLSGVVTINSALPTGGSNYQSFTAFANAVNGVGISGPLTVNVAANTSYTEQVQFVQITGMTSTNTITINGNGATITCTNAAAATPWTILLNGTDYMTISNLNMVGTGATYALVCHLWNGANNNQLLNCSFTAPLNGTSTTQVPLSISGTSVSGTATGNSGNNNVINTCTMTGGYYNTTLVGSSTTPFNVGNQLLNSLVRDFYFYGVYHYYCQNSIILNNVVERTQRTTISTGYGIYLTTGSINVLVERNHIRKMADAVSMSTSVVYAIYVAADATPGNENMIRNNLVSDIKANSTQAGVYMTGASYTLVYHNTIVINDPTSNTGTTYGIYCTGPNNKIRNNVVYITRTGTGSKNCIYLSTAATPLICNNNVLYMNSSAGTNGIGYLTNNYATLTAWQNATGFDMASSDVDPMFTNPSVYNYVPTNLAINNMCPPLGVTNDFNLVPRSPVFPDPGAFETYTTPCNGTPPANSFVTPTIALCPGTSVDLNLLNSGTYTNTGYNIQWQTSTSSIFGPFTSVSGATLNAYTTPPINTTTYFQALITCANGGGTLTVPAQSIVIAPTTTNTVPYRESFENLAPNRLANCSWAASNQGGTTLTFTAPASNYRSARTGSNYEVFAPGGTSYFYSNGIYMQPGITYSAALWFIHETAGYNNWADLSILLGTTQTPAFTQTIVSTNGTLTPQLYTRLSNTFVVQTAGLYYVGIRATAGAGAAPYLSWDDLSITIPCQHNTPFVQLAATAYSVCSGQQVGISAIGNTTFTWTNGQNGSSIVVFPTTASSTAIVNYGVIGTSTLSGCSNTVTQGIFVSPAPQVAAFASNPVICAGQQTTLSAQGAASYIWDNGTTSAVTVVSPTTTTTYSVMGKNAYNCTNQGMVQISVNPLPNVGGNISTTLACSGDMITLNGTGATSYQWMTSSSSIMFGNPLVIPASASNAYTLTGTDDNGCSANAYFLLRVDACTGLNEIGGTSSVKVYPNPSGGLVYIETGSASALQLDLVDVTGRVLLSGATAEGTTSFDLSNFANGIYYLKLRDANSASVVKIVKQ